MKHFMIAVVVSIVALSIPMAHAGYQPAMVKTMLERLAGSWTWMGEQANIGAENSPYGQAGRFVGSGEGRLIMDGQFILDEYQEKSPEGNVMHGVSLVGYDPVKKCFVSRDCMSDGSTSVAEFTIEERTRKDHITITSKTGEILLARVTGEYSRDWKRMEATWEGSTDNGKTWQHWCSLVSEKTGDGGNDEQELIRLQHEWSRVEVAGDVRTLDRLLADEYVLTLSDGTPVPKAKYLRDVQSEDTRSTAMAVENPTVRLYGDMALVKGIVKWTEPSGKKHEDLFHETWLKRDGRWQCLATHESEVKEIQEPSPEMKKFEGLVGDWAYEGEQVDPPVGGLPYGPAGKFSGTITNRFVLGGFFLESKLDENNPAGRMTGIEIIGYDPRGIVYTHNLYLSEGNISVSTSTLDGTTWTINSTMTAKNGKKVPVRHVCKYSSDWSNYTAITELSPDDGKTWKYWYKVEGTKVNN